MKARDKRGRFAKNEELFTLTFPSFKNLIYWISILLIFLPWLIILSKFNLIGKVMDIFDSIFNEKSETAQETGKKNGIFY